MTRSNENIYRMHLLLSREMDKLLTDIGVSAKESGGFKLRKAHIVRALVKVLQKIEKDVDVSGVKTEQDLTERILETIKKYRKK